MTIYIGNISYSVTATDLESIFDAYGNVVKITIPKDMEKGRIRGYAFVDLEGDTNEDAAIEALNKTQHMGRILKIEKARAQQQKNI